MTEIAQITGMTEDMFIELLKILPTIKTEVYKANKRKLINVRDFRSAFKIYVISYGLLPAVFFDAIENCIQNKKCLNRLNKFFIKHKLPIAANNEMVYHVDLMSENKQKWIRKKYAHKDSSLYMGTLLGYPELFAEKDWRYYDRTRTSTSIPYYSVNYYILYKCEELGLTKVWLTGWECKNAKNIYPKINSKINYNFMNDLRQCLSLLKKGVTDVEMTINSSLF